MRVLTGSNAPWGNTGYSTETRGLLRGIRDLGYEVACVAWWGLEGGSITWEGIPIFPKHLDGFGNDAMPYHAKRWRADILITLIDLWVLDTRLGSLGPTRWTPWFPIDHADPIPGAIAERFPHAHRLLTYSRWAEKLVKEHEGGKYADKVDYLPHGIDAAALRPSTPDEKRAARKRFYPDWPDNAYVFGMVAANKGYPARKSFWEVMEAFARFAAIHPEARLYLHSLVGSEFRGPNLSEMAHHYKVVDKVRFALPPMLLAGDYDEALMRELYATFDVLLAPSQGEGFCLPLAEAQACGVPVITTDHSAMTEVCGSGWRVPGLRTMPSLIWGRFAEADVEGIYHAMAEAYSRPPMLVEAMATAARQFALRYDWPVVIRDYWAPWLARMDAGRRERALDLEWQAGRYQPWPELAGLPQQNGREPALVGVG